MLYTVDYFRYDPATGLNCVETRVFGTRRTAELWAESVLGIATVSNGNYWRDIRRLSCVDIEERFIGARKKRRGNRAKRRALESPATVYPKIYIAPSVGELGYW